MSPQVLLVNTSMSQVMPSACGQTMVESNIPLPKEDTEDTSYPKALKTPQSQPPKKQVSSTLEFHLQNKKMTLSDKPNTSNTNTQITTSSPTQPLGSTTRDPVSRGFWKESSKAQSDKLWLPTKTVLQGLDMTSLNGFSHATGQSSFVIKNLETKKEVNSPMTSWLSSLYSQLDTMESGSTKTHISYCRKVRFYPSRDLKILLQKCFDGSRYLINQAIGQVRDGHITNLTNAIAMRNHLRYQDKFLTEENLWLKQIPYDTRDGAIRQLCSNFKTAFTQLKNGTIQKFKMNFKSKRSLRKTCSINKTAFKNGVYFPRRIKSRDKVRFAEDVSRYSEHGTLTIVYEGGKYYTCFPLKRERTTEKTAYGGVALDPGVRTFETFYSEEGVAGKLGDRTARSVEHLYKKEDKLKSKLKTECLSRGHRSNLKDRCQRLRTKVRHIVRDLHRKSSSWLTTKFKHIFLPEFGVKNMVSKSKRVLNRTVVRSMLSLSHYSFRCLLEHMGKSKGCKVEICSEAYTSKTCGCCGRLKNNLGGAKEYECERCGICIDRDYNGARNIYLLNTQSHGSDSAR